MSITLHPRTNLREQTYEEYEAEMEAIHNGTATELIACSVCAHAAHKPKWRIDLLDDVTGPLRGVVRSYVSKGHDPYQVYVLTCGHTII